MAMYHYDYVIVGGGSAGSALAARLSEDDQVRVLVLEAGPMDGGLFLEMPATFWWPLTNNRYNWAYRTEPEPHMDGRRMDCPRGRVFGGSSAINAMVWLRGNPLDYEGWADGGLPDWNYASCLPYFKRSETYERGADEYRGGEGPMQVTAGPCENPLHQAWLEAGQQAGYALTEDMNGYRQEGVGRMDRTVHRGRRFSAAKGYLHPARRERLGCTVEVGAKVRQILFDGPRLRGIEYRRLGATQRVEITRELILCAGVINSPQLLMLAGIGDGDHLREHDIPVRAHLPGVGRNLQDHVDLGLQYECRKPVSLYRASRGMGRVRAGLEWLVRKSGPAASNHFESGGFIRSREGVGYPDLQHHFLPIAAPCDGSEAPTCESFQVFLSTMRPESRGRVWLGSADPDDAPRIRFDYLSTEADRQALRDGVRLTREILAQPAFEPFIGREISPGAEVDGDAAIDAFARAHAETEHHASGTCRMGTDDDAVVDGEGRVHGVSGIRVVDASIMPRIVTGNLNATTIMMAEKIADRIRDQTPLTPQYAPFHQAPDHERSQR